MLEVMQRKVEVVTISSREVATMMEVQHSDLMRKIKNINKDFQKYNENIEISTECKIALCEFWLESKYQAEENGRWYDEYRVTKKGCEYLAMKGTGFKSNIFTAKYMQRFEQMEKALKELNAPSYQIQDPIERAKAWIREEEERQRQLETIKSQSKLLEEQKPKVILAETMMASEGSLSIGEFAKMLTKKGVKTGRNRLFSWLRNNEYIMKRGTNPTQKAIKLNVLEQVVTSHTLINGETKINTTSFVTTKGIEYFASKFMEEI